MSLSLNMIVRNGGENLERALDSVEHLDLGEIIVIDTGSKDDSIKVAESYGAFVAKMEWPDNFGLVRQCALALSDCEWVMYLDHDEWLSPETVETINRLMEGPMVPYVSILRQADGGEHWGQIRLFPREGAKWKYRVHEQIMYGNNGDAMLDPRLVVNHDGEIRSIEKAAYYLSLAKKDLEDFPDDLHCKKQVAFMMSAAHEPLEAVIPLLKEVKDSLPQMKEGEPPNYAAAPVYSLLVNSYRGVAFEALQEALKKGFGNWALGVQYAEICFTMNLPEETLRICDWTLARAWDGTGHERSLRRRLEMLQQWAQFEIAEVIEHRNPRLNGQYPVELDAKCRNGDYSGSRR